MCGPQVHLASIRSQICPKIVWANHFFASKWSWVAQWDDQRSNLSVSSRQYICATTDLVPHDLIANPKSWMDEIKEQCEKRDSRWSIRRPTLDQQKEIWKIQKNYRQWATTAENNLTHWMTQVGPTSDWTSSLLVWMSTVEKIKT